jgi:choline-phosphate cytidylyltransferase
MSSPSSSSQTGKRKRTTTTTNLSAADLMDADLQPSSRDASGEEGDTTAAESGDKHRNKSDSAAASAHPSKRQRANSDRTAEPTADDLAHAIDPGEPSDTTEASVDIAERVGRKTRRAQVTIPKDGGADDNNPKSMPPPPIGKLTHPVGYKTNPPPAGRAVRVYADGVFDLFHLGCVFPLSFRDQVFLL